MKSSSLTKVAGLFAALSLASAAFATMPPSAVNSMQASDLLATLHQDAFAVKDSASLLDAYNREPEIGWEAEGATLESMRNRIDKMDQILYRLRTLKGTLPQDQRAEINEITPAMMELTNTAQTAIDFLNNNEHLLWMPKYTAYADEMYSEANRIEQGTSSRLMVPYGNRVDQSAKTNTFSAGS